MNSTKEPMKVITRGIKTLMDGNPSFTEFVNRSLEQFLEGDWGDIPTDEKEANDRAIKDLDKGEPDMAQGVYRRAYRQLNSNFNATFPEIWIIRDLYIPIIFTNFFPRSIISRVSFFHLQNTFELENLPL